MSEHSSFIATLELDASSFRVLHAWRSLHFPPQRNFLAAHLTLFHTLSIAQIERLVGSRGTLESLARLELRFTRPRSLGNGVAIEVESSELHALRAELVEILGGRLTLQDQQRFRGHVTIQNKVDSQTADTLFREIRIAFQPWEGQGTALLLWRYLGGPWALETRIAFIGEDRRMPS